MSNITSFKPSKVPTLIWYALFFLLSSTAGLQFATPFAENEVILITSLYTLPISYLILRRFDGKLEEFSKVAIPLLKRGPDDTRPIPTMHISKLKLQFIAYAILMAFLTNCTLLANQILDQSPPDYKTFTIKDVSRKSGSRNTNKYYYARFDRPEFIKVPFDFGFGDRILISANDYPLVIPNQTKITVTVHQGFFGFPWMTRDYKLVDTNTTNVTRVNKHIPLNRSGNDELKEACLWAKNFDPNTDIEPLPAQDYHRDFWNGSIPRSVEPLVDGQNHGIGHYTFANGSVYADIPWSHGKKHGAFTLYREDGSKDQSLSYKNGDVYGINTWYDSNGNVRESWVYVSPRVIRPASDCALYLQ